MDRNLSSSEALPTPVTRTTPATLPSGWPDEASYTTAKASYESSSPLPAAVSVEAPNVSVPLKKPVLMECTAPIPTPTAKPEPEPSCASPVAASSTTTSSAVGDVDSNATPMEADAPPAADPTGTANTPKSHVNRELGSGNAPRPASSAALRSDEAE